MPRDSPLTICQNQTSSNPFVIYGAWVIAYWPSGLQLIKFRNDERFHWYQKSSSVSSVHLDMIKLHRGKVIFNIWRPHLVFPCKNLFVFAVAPRGRWFHLKVIWAWTWNKKHIPEFDLSASQLTASNHIHLQPNSIPVYCSIICLVMRIVNMIVLIPWTQLTGFRDPLLGFLLSTFYSSLSENEVHGLLQR